MTLIWKMHQEPVAQHVIQLIPVDTSGRVLTMHRTNKVRSAKNVWSFPSGMHDIGKTAAQIAEQELMEEYGLWFKALRPVGEYENIAGDHPALEQYHWVIGVYAAVVASLDVAVNKEPDKHDLFEIHPLNWLLSFSFESYPFHSSFRHWFEPNRDDVYYRICDFLEVM